MISKKNKKITLKNGKQYAIIDECMYNGIVYYIACEMVNDDITENYRVMQIYETEDNKQKIKIVENSEILKEIFEFFETQI